MLQRKKYLYFLLLLCIIFWFGTLVVEAGKTGKIAKNVVKAAVVNKALGKSHKPYRRGFPTWAIVLLVLGGSSVVGLGVFLFCLFRRKQSCWRPTLV